jgi:exonuclease SbcD
MRIVHFADLHLDTAFTWLRPEVARRRRGALRTTLRQIIALADEVEADAILCGGDLYEHDRFTPDTTQFVRQTLGATHRRVVIAPGNHDWFGPSSLYVQTEWSENVHVFREDRLRPLELEDGLTLWGAAHRAPANTDGFFDRGFEVPGGGVHLALFHGSERSGLPFEGEGKRPHASFDAEQVAAAGLHHAFLGHFHRPRAEATHTYPGNPDPLIFGEDGQRGAVVIDVHPDGQVSREWHDVAVSKVADLELDVTGFTNWHDIRQQALEVLDPHEGYVRLTVRGEFPPEAELRLEDLRSLVRDLPQLDGLLPRRGDLHVAYDLDGIAQENTVRGQFVRDVREADGLDQQERERIIVTGLRALEGRQDLEVV